LRPIAAPSIFRFFSTQMNEQEKIVISASRRTDIPAFYMEWFMAQVRQGFFEVVNPYNQRAFRVPGTPEVVHTIVFWSKDFGPFIHGRYAKTLEKMGYHLFFNFTINSEDPLLEPNVPPLADRLEQLQSLCERFVPESVQWRFDPLCFYQVDGGPIRDNLGQFERVADVATTLGVKRCVTSFMDDYPKIRKRTSRLAGFSFFDPPLAGKLETLTGMERCLTERGIALSTCCEKEIIEALPPSSGITQGSCIPNELLMTLFGGKISMERDKGQRVAKGCGCKISKDIGSYALHPCYHNCLFCYANPTAA
jgi:hypothetical protein